MSSPRFYIPVALAAQTTLALPEAAAHHAARVLRLRGGDAVTLFNGTGGEYTARITAIGRHDESRDGRGRPRREQTVDVTVAIERHDPVERESPLPVTLVQALSSGERMDLTIQKAVELGVSRIVPVESERCVVRLKGERAVKRVTHWQQVVISACEQCGRNRIPEVRMISPLDVWLAAEESDAQRWLLLPGARTALRELPRPQKPVELLVGPEGGLTDVEADAAQRAGYQPVRLGPRVLRTETAAPALLAAVQALWGDF
ncbi:MAG TPA: 16S rRNA (uracil(1498)-N(3))-methyltransferase [Acidiferrobacterales bacterium]|nr:16S rRNA (uracil(1498)-N(3))-methyltransferase [Acidiferrobacterales bacterium]